MRPYLLTPTQKKTQLSDINVLLRLGFCLQASEGKLIHTDCVGFSSGCPETPYITSDFYKCK